MGKLLNYIIRRLIFAVVSIFILSIMLFWIMQLAPGGPIEYFISTNPRSIRDPVFQEVMIKRMGLDQPVHVQYINWLTAFVTGDLGWSFVTGQRVSDMISARIIPTVVLALSSNILAILIAVPLGVICAVKKNSIIDNAAMLLAIFGISLPGFWFALMLLYIFALKIPIFPVGGIQSLKMTFPSIWTKILDQIHHLVLPVIALSITQLATITRLTRSNMLEVLKQDYIITARSKGLSEKVVIFKHALRNTLLPVVTMVGLNMAFMLSGSTLIERVFARSGLGIYIVNSVVTRDYPVIMATTIMMAIMVIIANFLTDISYALLDPRIKYG